MYVFHRSHFSMAMRKGIIRNVFGHAQMRKITRKPGKESGGDRICRGIKFVVTEPALLILKASGRFHTT